MRLREFFSFRRRRGDQPTAPGPAGPVARAPAWPGLPAVQRSLTGPPLITDPSAFREGLITWSNPSFLGTPGHLLSPEAPSGSVSGLAESGRRRSSPVEAVPAGPAAGEPFLGKSALPLAPSVQVLPAAERLNAPTPGAGSSLITAASAPLLPPVPRPAVPLQRGAPAGNDPMGPSGEPRPDAEQSPERAHSTGSAAVPDREEALLPPAEPLAVPVAEGGPTGGDVASPLGPSRPLIADNPSAVTAAPAPAPGISGSARVPGPTPAAPATAGPPSSTVQRMALSAPEPHRSGRRRLGLGAPIPAMPWPAAQRSSAPPPASLPTADAVPGPMPTLALPAGAPTDSAPAPGDRTTGAPDPPPSVTSTPGTPTAGGEWRREGQPPPSARPEAALLRPDRGLGEPALQRAASAAAERSDAPPVDGAAPPAPPPPDPAATVGTLGARSPDSLPLPAASGTRAQAPPVPGAPHPASAPLGDTVPAATVSRLPLVGTPPSSSAGQPGEHQGLEDLGTPSRRHAPVTASGQAVPPRSVQRGDEAFPEPRSTHELRAAPAPSDTATGEADLAPSIDRDAPAITDVEHDSAGLTSQVPSPALPVDAPPSGGVSVPLIGDAALPTAPSGPASAADGGSHRPAPVPAGRPASRPAVQRVPLGKGTADADDRRGPAATRSTAEQSAGGEPSSHSPAPVAGTDVAPGVPVPSVDEPVVFPTAEQSSVPTDADLPSLASLGSRPLQLLTADGPIEDPAPLTRPAGPPLRPAMPQAVAAGAPVGGRGVTAAGVLQREPPAWVHSHAPSAGVLQRAADAGRRPDAGELRPTLFPPSPLPGRSRPTPGIGESVSSGDPEQHPPPSVASVVQTVLRLQGDVGEANAGRTAEAVGEPLRAAPASVQTLPADTALETAMPAPSLVPTAARAVPAALTDAGTPAAGPADAAAVAPTDVDALVRRLYDPFVRRLKAELRLDRERVGRSLDLRH